jgi:hypothetical protein
MLLDRNGLDTLIVDRPFVGIELLRTHAEDSTGQLDQVRHSAHEETVLVPRPRPSRRLSERHPSKITPKE